MYKIYNTQAEISTNISNFLLKSFPNIRKTQLNIIPYIIFGMIISNSCSASSIAASLKDDFSKVKFDSVSKRIRRFFSNNLFDPYSFYSSFIKSILSTYKVKHKNNTIHLSIDHTYSHENYTILMISMRIGKQGIPLYFECFKGIHNSTAFHNNTIIKGIDTVSNYFIDTNFKLVFLADRWFNSQEVLKHIDDLGHSFCIRLKGNLKINSFDKNEGHFVHKYTINLKGRKYKGTYYDNVYLYEDSPFKTNITISKSNDIDEAWIVATNDNPKNAIRHYSHRFGGIESIFKNQKSNGFNLEKINNSSLKSFTSMYSLLCFCITWLIMIGADYTKNSKCYKNVKIETIKKYSDGTSVRTVSLFKLGLILFKRAFNSSIYIRIPYKFILYDV